jgi:hypothetical protein
MRYAAWLTLPRLLFIGLCASGCAPVLSAQGSSGCLAAAADTGRVSSRHDYLRQLVSSADSDYVATRQELGLPTMSANKVTLVTKQSTCQSAVTAMNAVRQEQGIIRQVWVYALGTAGYALDDPGQDPDVGYGDRPLYFFSRSFGYKLTLTGY